MTEEIQTRFSPNYLAIAIIVIITATILVIILIDHMSTQNKIAELKAQLSPETLEGMEASDKAFNDALCKKQYDDGAIWIIGC